MAFHSQDPSCIPVVPEDLDGLGEKGLAALARTMGSACRVSQARFLSLLPALARLQVHRSEGFASVEEYAGRVAGLPAERVRQVLRMGARLEATRKVWRMLADGRIGWSKVRTVLAHVTPETEEWWVDVLGKASKRDLEEIVARFREEQDRAARAGVTRPAPEPAPAPAEAHPVPPPTATRSRATATAVARSRSRRGRSPAASQAEPVAKVSPGKDPPPGPPPGRDRPGRWEDP